LRKNQRVCCFSSARESKGFTKSLREKKRGGRPEVSENSRNPGSQQSASTRNERKKKLLKTTISKGKRNRGGVQKDKTHGFIRQKEEKKAWGSKKST